MKGAVGVVWESGRGAAFERGVFASGGVWGRAKGSFVLARSPEEKNAE